MWVATVARTLKISDAISFAENSSQFEFSANPSGFTENRERGPEIENLN